MNIAFEHMGKNLFTPLYIENKPFPDDMEDIVNKYLYHINHENGLMEDCFREEIRLCIRDYCQSGYFTDEEAELLKEYYVYKGIYKNIENM